MDIIDFACEMTYSTRMQNLGYQSFLIHDYSKTLYIEISTLKNILS